MSGGVALPGVDYPRQIPPPEGLPAGWTAVEYAYKSGKQLGKTYVRFNSPIRKDTLCTIKQVLEKDALNRGLSQKEASEIVKEYEALQKEKKDEQKKKRQELGLVGGEQKEEAVRAFRAMYGQLDGATVSNLPGWRAESIFRESCKQTAVTYFNPEGRAYSTVKAVEAFFGVRVQKGEDCPEVREARSKVVVNEKGKTVNLVRHEIGSIRSAEETRKAKEAAKERRADPEAWGRKRRPIPANAYRESDSFALVRVPSRVGTGAAVEKQAAALEEDLCKAAAAIQDLLVERGFKDTAELLALQGCPSTLTQVKPLGGIYHERPENFNGKPYFQQVWRHSRGGLACSCVYIFWSEMRSRWKIGPLDDDSAPWAYLPGDRDRPTQSGDEAWFVYSPAAASAALEQPP